MLRKQFLIINDGCCRPTVEKEWPVNHKGGWTSGLERKDTWQEARKLNADSLQVQEASSQIIGGHGKVAQ